MHKRITIGFFIPQLDDHYQESIWPGVSDYCTRHDLNLLIFCGKMLNLPGEFTYQHQVIYALANRRNLDGLVICNPNMISLMNEQVPAGFADQLNGVPTVTIATPLKDCPAVLIDGKQALKDAVNHLIQDHRLSKIAFITGPQRNPEAQERLAAYQEALEENGIEIDEGLIIQGNFLFDSGQSAVTTLFDKRGFAPQAIVAANDEMGLGALKELQRRGVKVPDDVAIVGYDNIAEGLYCDPPLSTVAQPLYAQAQMATQLLHKRIIGEPIEDRTVLKADLKIRESCGCFSQSIQKLNELKEVADISDGDELDVLKRAFEFSRLPPVEIDQLGREFLDRIHSFLDDHDSDEGFLRFFKAVLTSHPTGPSEIRNWHNVLTCLASLRLAEAEQRGKRLAYTVLFEKARILVGEREKSFEGSRLVMHVQKTTTLADVSQSLLSNFNEASLSRLITSSLPKLNIESCYIVLYKSTIDHFPRSTWTVPQTARLWLGYTDYGKQLIYGDQRTFPTAELLPAKHLHAAKARQLVIEPLFYGEEQLGYLAMTVLFENTKFYGHLSAQIASALKAAQVMQERTLAENKLTAAMDELRSLNRTLENLSEKDELTGRYNRRGFQARATAYIKQARDQGEKFLLFFVDLDGLKLINDNHGHDEGDIAIVETARILGEIFRDTDIIARLGGDEFVILAINCSNASIPVIERRYRKCTETLNRTLGKPYTIDLSMGYAEYDGVEKITLEQLMTRADNDLYRVKKAKKAAKSSQ